MLQRHEDVLADAIAETANPPVSATSAKAVARFALAALDLAREHPERRTQVLAEVFGLLRHGWPG